MRIDPPFPANLRNDPMRRAERLVYRHLAQSNLPGRVLYQVRADRHGRELDFLVLPSNGPRIGIEVKGGNYRLRGGIWQLRTPDGWQRKPSPLTQICDAVVSVQDVISPQIGRKVPIVPVLAFPDMRADPDIDSMAGAAGVRIMWGQGRFVERLVDLAEV